MNVAPLEVWFVNVGHGDSTIVRFPSGRVMMLDINNSRALDKQTENELFEAVLAETHGVPNTAAGLLSLRETRRRYEELLEDPIDILKSECPGAPVFRYVQSHPDMDHMTGLYRLFYEEPATNVLNFWDTANTKSMSTKDFEGTQYDQRDWDTYQRIRRGDTQSRVLRLERWAQGNFWTDDGIILLSPTKQIIADANATEDWNHLSSVLMLIHGQSRVILPGDASIAVQEVLARICGDDLRSTILKAPHHGRDTGYCNEFVKLVQPDYTIVSVGKKPANDASNKYRQHSKRVYSTRFQGTIHAKLFQDGTVRIYNHANERIDIVAGTERLAVLFNSLVANSR